jgi:hypothetical protein
VYSIQLQTSKSMSLVAPYLLWNFGAVLLCVHLCCCDAFQHGYCCCAVLLCAQHLIWPPMHHSTLTYQKAVSVHLVYMVDGLQKPTVGDGRYVLNHRRPSWLSIIPLM